MKLRKIYLVIMVCLMTVIFAGCGKSNESLSDGEYIVEFTTEGGTGKATMTSPAKLTVSDGEQYLELVWTSKNYDYMVVEGITYYNENVGGNSTFTVKVSDLKKPLTVIGDTTAMSTPHEIEYIINFGNIKSLGQISFNTLEHEGSVLLSYASKFSIDKYGDYELITIADGGRFLLIPEKKSVPGDIPDDIVVLKMPLDMTYLVSSSVMDFIVKLDVMDNIKLSGVKQSDWFIDEAVDRMEKGQLLYAGKYGSPDYELITSTGCNLAIENTMILHKPEVKEKLEELNIPVLVEYSSYEEHPLGRLEWIKLYGHLFNKVAEAEDYYNHELEMIEPIMQQENTGKTVAFFYVNSSGMINVRKPNDYISKMIKLSGGNYCLDDALVEEENTLSTMNMQMEDFYVAAKDADIIIYNSTIEGELKNIDELISKNDLFRDFSAVKNKKVYCTGKNFFQETTGMAEFMKELNYIVNDDETNYVYLKRLD